MYPVRHTQAKKESHELFTNYMAQDIFEQLTMTDLVKRFTDFQGTPRFIIATTHVYLRYMLTLSSNVCVCPRHFPHAYTAPIALDLHTEPIYRSIVKISDCWAKIRIAYFRNTSDMISSLLHKERPRNKNP
jgi:hypothetical protein